MKKFRPESLDFVLTRGFGGRHFLTVGGQYFSTRPGAARPHVGALVAHDS